jgi:hypothetical protein
VEIFRSNNNIVIPPAKTGREAIKRKAATTTAHTKSPTLEKLSLILRKLKKVIIKLSLLKIDPKPARCNLKIAKSTELPLCPKALLKGG